MKNSMNERQTALVVGGASGVGLEYVKYFAKMGIDIVVVHPLDVKEDDAFRTLSKSYDVRVEGLALDLSNKASILQLRSRLEGLRIISYVNNAMEAYGTGFDSLSRLEASRFMDIHMNATVSISLYLLKMMLERNEGSIIQLSSGVGRIADAQSGMVFSSAKSFVRQFARGLSQELKDTDIHVQVVALGPYSVDIENGPIFGHKVPGLKHMISAGEFVDRAMGDLSRKVLFSAPCVQKSHFRKTNGASDSADVRKKKIS